MCGNRVEELESRVQELEASVEGLTDELVESKVRIRELEDAFEEELGFVPEPTADEATTAETESDFDTPTADDDVEASNTEPAETEDKTEESSDIIIA